MAGCSHDSPRTMDRPSQSQSVQRESDKLGGIVADVQNAKTPQAEADALRRLRKHELDEGLTYTVRAVRTYDNAPVDDPSTRPDPVLVTVTIFRGRDLVRTFNFYPRDNRNLVLMGE